MTSHKQIRTLLFTLVATLTVNSSEIRQSVLTPPLQATRIVFYAMGAACAAGALYKLWHSYKKHTLSDLEELRYHLSNQQSFWKNEAHLPSTYTVESTHTISNFDALRDIPDAPRNYRELRELENSFLLFASDKPIGHIAYKLDPIKKEARIAALNIATAHQKDKNPSLDSMLMRYTMQQIKNRGYETVTLFAVSNTIDFYEEQGFTSKFSSHPNASNPTTYISNTHIYSFKDRFAGFGSESDPLSFSS